MLHISKHLIVYVSMIVTENTKTFEEKIQFALDNSKPYIPTKPEDWNKYWMRRAYMAETRSKDPSTRVGAVFVKDNHDLLTGYNGFPRGVVDSPERLNNRDIKYNLITHAERAGVDKAAKRGISTDQCVVYTQGIPCSGCANSLIGAGIVKVYYHLPYQKILQTSLGEKNNWRNSIQYSIQMFIESKVELISIDDFLDVQTVIGGRIYTL